MLLLVNVGRPVHNLRKLKSIEMASIIQETRADHVFPFGIILEEVLKMLILQARICLSEDVLLSLITYGNIDLVGIQYEVFLLSHWLPPALYCYRTFLR